MTPEPSAAAEKTVDAIVRQAMDDHMRSLMAGEADRVRADFAESVKDRIDEFEGLVPPGLKSYTVRVADVCTELTAGGCQTADLRTVLAPAATGSAGGQH